MKKNTEFTENGSEIYTHRIYELADQYIQTMEDPKAIYNPTTSFFNGMIKYIRNRYFRYHPIDYADIDQIDEFWDMYTSLCYKYNKYPNITEFCLLINISRNTLWEWKEGISRGYKYYTLDGKEIKDLPTWKLHHKEEYRKELSTRHSDIVKRWHEECENAIFRGATEGNKVGCIFALKARYGYTETAAAPASDQPRFALSASELPRLNASEAQERTTDSARMMRIEQDIAHDDRM